MALKYISNHVKGDLQVFRLLVEIGPMRSSLCIKSYIWYWQYTLMDWCEENIYGWYRVSSLEFDDYLIVCFKEPSDALLFKLVWS